ncbi:Crp/Fnr family transcriptional regulator [Rugamonas rubra]|uniref:cAMP-binding domain of CRP or a regulatory subunit of cAMP-dependent protein kinases n=1 Tax=Rugamonas rubra TaxID=758825 RepID=A0A1I4ND07_9BURK|nr:cAMP-binding domain of CRP or a regulatory subunit of cAMP-dependent protein kinases [Rugamonas rubra]
MNTIPPPGRNTLLAAILAGAAERLGPQLEAVQLRQGEVLCQSGARLNHVYFPSGLIISVQHILENGNTSELASIGTEGLLGIASVMGGAHPHSRAVVQAGGDAYRLPAALLRLEFHRRPEVMRLLLRYTQYLMSQLAQMAVCNRHHSTEQRLCRWLLQRLDHGPCNELRVTQEALGAALGVRREGVTDIAGRLQVLGAIELSRGRLIVLDRAVLARHACECYSALRDDARLLARDEAAAAEWRPRIGAANRRADSPDRRAARPSRAAIPLLRVAPGPGADPAGAADADALDALDALDGAGRRRAARN